MRNTIGKLCIILGMMLFLGAGVLFLYNRAEAANAEHSAQELMPKLVQSIVDRQEEVRAPLLDEGRPEEPTVPEQKPVYAMQEVEIDGHNYIGFLSIPSLELELPVMADWSYPKLRIAPCRFHGTVLGEDLVIMAHNYKKHFGRLAELQEGDTVTFIDVNGIAADYVVVGRDVLMPDAVEELVAGDYDLILFTCTYGGKSRVTIYLDRSRDAE